MLYRKVILFFWFLSYVYFGRNIKTGFLFLLSESTTMQRTITNPVLHLNPPEPVDFNLNDAQGL